MKRYRLNDGDIVKGIVNEKGWLEWILKEDNGQIVTGLSRPGTFTEIKKEERIKKGNYKSAV